MSKAKRSTKLAATAKVNRILPRKGVELVFTGESATKPWLKRGARLKVRGRLECHGRTYIRVECVVNGKSRVFCLAPQQAVAKSSVARRTSTRRPARRRGGTCGSAESVSTAVVGAPAAQAASGEHPRRRRCLRDRHAPDASGGGPPA